MHNNTRLLVGFMSLLLLDQGHHNITYTSQTIMNALFFGYDAGTSVEMKRLHDQLLPNVTMFERGFDQVCRNCDEVKFYQWIDFKEIYS